LLFSIEFFCMINGQKNAKIPIVEVNRSEIFVK